MVVSLGSPTTWVELSSSKTCAAGLGLATHLILKNGDWDHTAHKILYAWGVGIVAISTVGYTFDHNIASMGHAIQVYSSIVAVYFGVLLTSILIYRAFFHRLNRACLASSTVKTITDTTLQFPGPFLLRLSKLGNITYVLPNRQWHMAAENLHTEYKSDIIRIGPRELSIIDAEAIPLVHGPFSKCRKGPFYGFMEHIEGFSVHTTPSKQEHKERRKLWDKALSTKSLRDYEPRLNRYAYSLVSKLHEHTKEPSVRLSDWVNFYSFDVMGDIGYSHKFEMLENGNEGHLIGTVHKGMVPLSVFNHLPWALSLFTRFGSVKDILDFSAWTASTLKARKKITPKEKDIFGWLLDPEDDHVPQHLIADSKLLTVAGSDTTAATLTWLFYELCKDLAVQAKLRDAVDQIKPEKVFLDADDLTDCPYLDGAINEALRLHPAVPSGVQRETPPEGLTLPNGTYIPGETLIYMPMHTIHRDARYFSSPFTFAPERWTEPETATTESKTSSTQLYTADRRAFMPFGNGPYSCVGQKLAMVEMRTVAANIVRTFEIRFADGEDGSGMEKGTMDCFTLCVGTLDVKLRSRKGTEA